LLCLCSIGQTSAPYSEKSIDSLLIGPLARKMQLSEVRALARQLEIILRGLETDSQEALGPFRTSQNIRDVQSGLTSARGCMDRLLVKLEEV
jgi:hypothetical protein